MEHVRYILYNICPGYIIGATIVYYRIRNDMNLRYGKNGLFYYKTTRNEDLLFCSSIQDVALWNEY